MIMGHLSGEIHMVQSSYSRDISNNHFAVLSCYWCCFNTSLDAPESWLRSEPGGGGA